MQQSSAAMLESEPSEMGTTADVLRPCEEHRS